MATPTVGLSVKPTAIAIPSMKLWMESPRRIIHAIGAIWAKFLALHFRQLNLCRDDCATDLGAAESPFFIDTRSITWEEENYRPRICLLGRWMQSRNTYLGCGLWGATGIAIQWFLQLKCRKIKSLGIDANSTRRLWTVELPPSVIVAGWGGHILCRRRWEDQQEYNLISKGRYDPAHRIPEACLPSALPTNTKLPIASKTMKENRFVQLNGVEWTHLRKEYQ